MPLIAVLLLAPALAGCVQTPDPVDPAGVEAMGHHAASWARDLPDVITGLEHVAKADAPSGSGIWVHGNWAFVSGRDTGFHVVDVSEPTAPVTIATLASDLYARDVDFLAYEDGRHVAVAAGASQGIHFINVTDPANPELITTLELDGGSHNLAVVPDTQYVLNARSNGRGGDIEIIDAADPAMPVSVGKFGDHGCHDITFFTSEEKQRLYCPGIEETQIYDIADLFNATVVARITNPFIAPSGEAPTPGLADPGLHHLAMVDEKGEVLMIGDEFTGGLGPGCGAHTGTGKDTPVGALYFYDIKGENEKDPVLLGRFAPTVPVEEYATGTVGHVTAAQPQNAAFDLSCTSHFGQVIPGHQMVAMSWYRAGVILIDFSDPSTPVQVDQWNPGTNTWDVRYLHGYLFTGDMSRGLDVLTLQ